MEIREIYIANTKTQKRESIQTDATTLGELKAALTAEGIDYSGMTFTEGITKTQLLDDSSPLPQNVQFKGETTNKLVIILTNTKKNIALGTNGSRNEAKEIINSTPGLKDEIKRQTGKNWTIVPSDTLWVIINSFNTNSQEEEEEVYNNYEETSYNDNRDEEDNDNNSNSWMDNDAGTTLEDTAVELSNLVEKSVETITNNIVLQVKNLYGINLFSSQDVENLSLYIKNIITQQEPDNTSFSSSDIDNMINELI